MHYKFYSKLVLLLLIIGCSSSKVYHVSRSTASDQSSTSESIEFSYSSETNRYTLDYERNIGSVEEKALNLGLKYIKPATSKKVIKKFKKRMMEHCQVELGNDSAVATKVVATYGFPKSGGAVQYNPQTAGLKVIRVYNFSCE